MDASTGRAGRRRHTRYTLIAVGTVGCGKSLLLTALASKFPSDVARIPCDYRGEDSDSQSVLGDREAHLLSFEKITDLTAIPGDFTFFTHSAHMTVHHPVLFEDSSCYDVPFDFYLVVYDARDPAALAATRRALCLPVEGGEAWVPPHQHTRFAVVAAKALEADNCVPYQGVDHDAGEAFARELGAQAFVEVSARDGVNIGVLYCALQRLLWRHCQDSAPLRAEAAVDCLNDPMSAVRSVDSDDSFSTRKTHLTPVEQCQVPAFAAAPVSHRTRRKSRATFSCCCARTTSPPAPPNRT